MIRLHEFITKIRNCKTIAEERAEYQKEMAAIRQSFAKNQQQLRPRNVTKLLFINMSGQETNFGQMECLKLITANSLIQKRIGYLGLTQLFYEKSELLMMATHRLRVDLNCMNNNIVALTLCVLSQICTSQLAKELHNDVLKCISSSSAYIRKKAILTAIKIIKKQPSYIEQFLPKISACLDEKSHGVLLSCMAFLQNVLLLRGDALSKQLVDLVPKISRAYRLVSQQHNAEYEISGVQDPFLQVAILKFLRLLRKYNATFDRQFAEILIISHDTVCSRVSSNLKNGANAVLFECFQCFMLLEPTAQLKQMVANVLSKFISVKDANSKYLSLFNLNLMTKYDIKIVKNHKSTIFQCLSQNDLLIRIMALDLLYVIASPDNVTSIVKQLLNALLAANDQDFISQLALKICLIVEKHSQSRRWHFDMILKVLILADQSVKEESAKSLVHLVTSTQQLQEYCMVKLFFSTSDHLQSDALCKTTLYLIGQLAEVLLRFKGAPISEENILDLIDAIIFKVGISNDTISYGLSALLKLYQKFPTFKQRISKMIKSFQTHNDLQVQKRACEYIKLLSNDWDQDRKKEICIAVPPFKLTVQTFKNIPIGQTDLDLDLKTVKYPQKQNINYDGFMLKQDQRSEVHKPRPVNQRPKTQQQEKAPIISQPIVQQIQPQPIKSIIDDDDIFNNIVNAPPAVQPKQPQPKQPQNIFDTGLGGISFGGQPQQKDDFGLLGFDIGGGKSAQIPQAQNIFNISPPVSTGNAFSFGFDPVQPVVQPAVQPVVQPVQTQPQVNLFQNDFLGMGSLSSPAPVNNANLGGGFNFNQQTTLQTQPQVGFSFNTVPSNPVSAPVQQQHNPNKFIAYENGHLQIWAECIKEGNDTTRIITTYVNKTQSQISDLSAQIAVLKHIKLNILGPLSSTTMPALSKEVVNQSFIVVNSMVGQKPLVMKLKLTYAQGGQKHVFEEKIQNFPANV